VGPGCRRERGKRERVGLARGGLGRLASRVRPRWAPGLFLLLSFFVIDSILEPSPLSQHTNTLP
jgi:hypothetical protein